MKENFEKSKMAENQFLIPDLKGKAGDEHNRDLKMLRELLAEKNKSGAMALSDYLINILENRCSLFPKSCPSICPTMEALYPIRLLMEKQLPLPEWRQKGFTLLPFPRDEEVLTIRHRRDPRSGAFIEIKAAGKKEKELEEAYHGLIRKINEINGLIKTDREENAAGQAELLLDTTVFAFKAPSEQNPTDRRRKEPKSIYERTFVDSMPELKDALLDFLELFKKIKK